MLLYEALQLMNRHHLLKRQVVIFYSFFYSFAGNLVIY
jgi:hypothetical protein